MNVLLLLFCKCCFSWESAWCILIVFLSRESFVAWMPSRCQTLWCSKIEPQCQPKGLRFYSLSNCIFGFSLILTFIVGDMEEAIVQTALFEVDKLYFFLCVERQDRWCRSNGDKVTMSVSGFFVCVLFFVSLSFSLSLFTSVPLCLNLFRIN